MRGILKYCVRGLLKDQQSEALVSFCDALAALCAPTQDKAKLAQLRQQVDVALALMEAAFPLSLQVSCLSLGNQVHCSTGGSCSN